MVKFLFDRVGNIMGNEDNAVYQHFFLFPQGFQKAFSAGVSKVVVVW